MYRVFVEAVFQTALVLGCSFGVDAGVDTRFGFFGSPASSSKLSRFVGDVYIAGGAVFAVSADTEASAFIAAVVLNVPMGEGGRLKAVFPFAFGTSGGNDDAALKVCVISDFDLITVFSGINTALLGYGGMVGSDFA